MAIKSEAMSRHKSRFTLPGLRAAQTKQFESRQAIRSFTYLALSSPLFVFRFIAQTTAFTCELLEQQIVYTKQLTNIILAQPPSEVTSLEPNLPFARTADDVVEAADGAVPARVTTPDDDQQIQLEGEWVAIDKQRVNNGEARKHHALASDVDVDSELSGALRIPFAEQRMNVAKEAVVKEIVGIAKRSVAHIENVGGIAVRHEELPVDDATTILATNQGVDHHEKLVTTVDAALPALLPMSDPTTKSAEQEQASVDERVRERAYALWEAEGRPEGRPLDYWTQAEREIYAMPIPATAL